MAWNVYPTEAPVGDWYGYEARAMREFQLTTWMSISKSSPLASFRYSGSVFTQGAGLSVDIPAGIFVIAGYVVEVDAAENLLGLSGYPDTNYIFATIIKTGDVVTSGAYVSNTTGAEPANPAVLLGKIVFDEGNLTSVISVSQAIPRICSGSHAGNGGSKSVFLGFQPKMVEVTANYRVGIAFPGSSRGIESIDTPGYWVLAPGTTSVPGITTFGFNLPATLNPNGYTVYWTAWA